jgi:transposase
MAKAYSYNLWQKVMQAIELDGMKKSEASHLFNLSRNTYQPVVSGDGVRVTFLREK